MKTKNYPNRHLAIALVATIGLVVPMISHAQEDAKEEVQTIAIHSRPLQRVGNTFESVWLIDNQTVLVPLRKTFEFDIQHRFGVMGNGYTDLFGLYAPSNIRLGFGYTPIKNMMVGIGFTKERLLWDVNVKYAILKQGGENDFPVSVTYYGVAAVDTREKEKFIGYTQATNRYSYFHQLMVARKFTRDLSLQGSINLSHMNSVPGFFNTAGDVEATLKNDHLSASVLGRYKISDAFAFIGNYDHPITQHPQATPKSNLALGVELATPLHAFQVFVGNYQWIVPQYNNFFNQNDFTNTFDAILIGFNITRLLDVQEENLGEMMFKRKAKK